MQTLITQKQQWYTLSQQFSQEQGQLAFAHTNALLRYCQILKQPILHFWTLQKTVILGMMDTKLPDYQAAIERLTHQDYAYFVRNAGGLGVLSDEGVLNVSLYLPDAKSLSIDDAYLLMTDLMQQTFQTNQANIEHFEITHSYCPGTFDLSINQQKFAGIAQRRVGTGVAVLLYLSVNGNQQHRGEIMRDFYDAGRYQAQTKWHFPEVYPESMANLSTLLNRDLTVQQVIALITQTLQKSQSSPLYPLDEHLQTPTYQTILEKSQRAIARHNP